MDNIDVREHFSKYMTDCPNAKRLMLMWVPKKFSRWKRASWAICLGRLWIQCTPPTSFLTIKCMDLSDSNGII